MATQHKRGWIWSDEEKAWTRSWKRKVQGRCNSVSVQVERFSDMLPQFADDAVSVAERFLHTGKRLLTLDGRTHGRKYEPMSPEEAREILAQHIKAFSSWTTFAARQDVRDAVNSINKDIARSKREHKRKLAEAEEAMHHRFDSPEFAAAVDAMVAQVMASSIEFLVISRSLNNYGGETAIPILERLFIVHFVRSTYEYDSERRAAMSSFLHKTPRPPMSQVLRQSLYLTMTKNVLDRLRQKPALHYGAVVSALMGSILESLSLSVEKWQKEGIAPEEIGDGYFTILDINYSLAAMPE